MAFDGIKNLIRQSPTKYLPCPGVLQSEWYRKVKGSEALCTWSLQTSRGDRYEYDQLGFKSGLGQQATRMRLPVDKDSM